jgi:hypothetical protein
MGAEKSVPIFIFRMIVVSDIVGLSQLKNVKLPGLSNHLAYIRQTSGHDKNSD